jgi:hypothetical protein
MNRNILLITVLAAGLAGPLAAQAKQVNPPAPQTPAPATPAPATDPLAPYGPIQAAPAQSATQAGTPVSATTDANGMQIVASAPVPDTPANRAKYGKPMSRAGRLTKPVGN